MKKILPFLILAGLLLAACASPAAQVAQTPAVQATAAIPSTGNQTSSTELS